ncbi:MAG: aminopeptidase [Bacteroidales bacterium]|nr:aminopeptidase [Bacteroidales bacterium]
MKKIVFLVVLYFIVGSKLISQTNDFTVIKELSATPVKNQYLSGTCWAFATTSFIESELMRMGKAEFDLSEIFTVRNIYKEKAITHIRMQGYNFFTPGGQAHNVFFSLNNFGAVPENIYSGKVSGEMKHNHSKLDSLMKLLVNTEEKAKCISPSLLNSIDSVLDTFLGKEPKSFKYQGKNYTPVSFYQEILEISSDDYIEITSFTHEPYYAPFCLKDKYNWASELYYNVPLTEFSEIVENALINGYTVNWNGDVSETGFRFYDGTATLDINSKTATSEMRQKLYNSQETTVDHLMHICGKAKNKSGEQFYYVKNSWGTGNIYKGFMYMSETYFKLKTISITVHKNAIPANIMKKLNLNYPR